MADFFDPIISSQVQDYLANQQATADQTVQDPYAPGLTLNEIDGNYLPEIEKPAILNTPLPTIAPVGSSESQSVDTARKGLNHATFAADVGGGEAAQAEQRIFEESAAEGASNWDPLLQQAAATRDAGKQAAQSLGEAASAEQLAIANNYDQQAALLAEKYTPAMVDAARSEQRRAESASKLWQAKHAQAEDTFARMSIKPKDFQLELGLSMAVDSWLALWGVKTNNTSAVLEQIKNDINVQMENMQHGRDVRDGFRMAYQLSEQIADTKKEQADQIFGMVLKGYSYKLEGDKARAKSTTELANIKAKQAEIDGIYLENYNSLQGAKEQDIAQRRDDRTKLRQLAIEKHMEEERLRLARAAARAKAPAGPTRDEMADTTIYVGGLPFGRARNKQEAPKIQAALDEVQSTTEEMRELIRLTKQVGLKAPKSLDKITKYFAGEDVSLNFLADEKDRRALAKAKALYEYISGNYRRSVSGQAVSEGEMSRFATVMQVPSIVNQQGEATLYQFNDLIASRARRALGNSIYELTPEEKASSPIGVGARAAGGFPTDAAGQEGRDLSEGASEVPPTRIEAKLESAQADPSSYTEPSKNWKGFAETYGGKYGWTKDKMPNTAAEVDSLTPAIKDKATVEKTGSTSKAAQEKIELGRQAESVLQEIAYGNSLMAPYAQYVIDRDYKYLNTTPRNVPADEAAAEADRVKPGSAKAQDQAAKDRVTSPEYFQGAPGSAKAKRDADQDALYQDRVKGYGRLK